MSYVYIVLVTWQRRELLLCTVSTLIHTAHSRLNEATALILEFS